MREPSTRMSAESSSSIPVSLQNTEVKAAIRMEHLPGAVVEISIGDGTHRTGNIGGFPHTALGQQALGNSPVVVGGYFGHHVGSNDAGLYFKYGNIVIGQAGGEQLDCHAERCFGHAVIAAADRSRETRDGADENDTPSGPIAHAASDFLGEKVRALQVSFDQLVEAFGCSFENIEPLAWRHAGIIDQEINSRKTGVEFFQELVTGASIVQLALHGYGSGGGRDFVGGLPVRIISGDYLMSFG